MGKIPVLEDNQMQRLRGLLGSGKSVNLCPQSQKKNRRLPGEEPEPTKSSGIQMSAVVTGAAGGFGAGAAKDIVPNTDGTYSVSSGGAVLGYINPYL